MRIITENSYLHIGLSWLVKNSFDESKTKRLVFIDTTYLPELSAADFDGFIVYITPRKFNIGWKELFSTEVKQGETIDMTMSVEDIRKKINFLTCGSSNVVNGVQHRYRLTEKEVSTIHTLACGITPDTCSLLTGSSIKTISAHKRSAMEKLGLKNQQELINTLNLLSKYIKIIHTIE